MPTFCLNDKNMKRFWSAEPDFVLVWRNFKVTFYAPTVMSFCLPLQKTDYITVYLSNLLHRGLFIIEHMGLYLHVCWPSKLNFVHVPVQCG